MNGIYTTAYWFDPLSGIWRKTNMLHTNQMTKTEIARAVANNGPLLIAAGQIAAVRDLLPAVEQLEAVR